MHFQIFQKLNLILAVYLFFDGNPPHDIFMFHYVSFFINIHLKKVLLHDSFISLDIFINELNEI